MKKQLKRFWTVLFILTAFCFSAAAEEDTPVFALPVGGKQVEIRAELIDEEYWLFLPAFAQIEELSVSGAELEWWDTEPDEDGLWYADIVLSEEESLTVNVMRGENLRALFLFSDDPVNYGREYIDNAANKYENTATASMSLVSTQGNIDHADRIPSFRIRGNWTRSWPKKAYQMKLENRADLLDTGNADNRSRTWVLLAECLDSTLLHNRIVSDLALELGAGAMESEYVDLYYDGCYRGVYLLSEKVQVGEGRVDVLDYDELLKKWNNKVGQYDLELLAAAEDTNRYGSRFTYVEGVVEDSRPDAGAFLVEMESEGTLSDRCYFWLQDSETVIYALKSPENASQNMMRFISEKLQSAQDLLRAGGVHPETGRTLEQEFDLDAFARTLLIQELSYNVDGYTYSSSWFVLPEGSDRFQPGPVWDFDLSFRYYWDGRNHGAAGFKDAKGWLTDFYRSPVYLKLARDIYLNELYPLVRDVLLGDGSGRYLQSLDSYQAHLSASAAMNEKLWGVVQEGRFYYGDSFISELAMLRRFLTERSEWLYHAMTDLEPENALHIPLWMDVSFTNPDDSVRLLSAPWQNVTAQVVSTEQLTEATEEAYALWQMEAVIASGSGSDLSDCTITVNGTPLETEVQEDGTLLIRAVYEDRSYRPVDYYGEDVGLVYQYDAYVAAYPEVAEECGYDEEAVLDYFFSEGIYEGHIGNGLFDPREAPQLLPYLSESLYEDWDMYYWEFLSWGYEAEWMANTMARFVPAVTPAE